MKKVITAIIGLSLSATILTGCSLMEAVPQIQNTKKEQSSVPADKKVEKAIAASDPRIVSIDEIAISENDAKTRVSLIIEMKDNEPLSTETLKSILKTTLDNINPTPTDIRLIVRLEGEENTFLDVTQAAGELVGLLGWIPYGNNGANFMDAGLKMIFE